FRAGEWRRLQPPARSRRAGLFSLLHTSSQAAKGRDEHRNEDQEQELGQVDAGQDRRQLGLYRRGGAEQAVALVLAQAALSGLERLWDADANAAHLAERCRQLVE